MHVTPDSSRVDVSSMSSLAGDLTGSQQIRWKEPCTPSQNNTHLGALLLASCLALGESLNFTGMHFYLSNKWFELG